MLVMGLDYFPETDRISGTDHYRGYGCHDPDPGPGHIPAYLGYVRSIVKKLTGVAKCDKILP